MSFAIEVRDYSDADVTRLVAQVQREYFLRYGSGDAAAIEPAEFSPPAGLFLVGLLDEVAVAMGGWRSISPSVGEIKRMYVAAPARRRGLARVLLADLEARAAAAGIRRLVLNTGTEQPEAVALYESNGYAPAPGYGLYESAPLALFYGKDL